MIRCTWLDCESSEVIVYSKRAIEKHEHKEHLELFHFILIRLLISREVVLEVGQVVDFVRILPHPHREEDETA